MGHNPTEHVQEHVTHEAAHGGHDHGGGAKWITAAALTAALLAALAAITGALGTYYLTESTRDRIEANDKWNFFGQKSIKSSNIDTRLFNYALARSSLKEGEKLSDEVELSHKNDLAKKKEYNDESVADSMPNIKKQAEEKEKLSEAHLKVHETFEFGATMFHIAIAVVAISVVARRKEFWAMSMVLGVIGLYFFLTAFAHVPAHAAHGEHHDAVPHSAPADQHAPAAEPAHH